MHGAVEPSTKIKVFAPNDNPMYDETLTMRPDTNERLTWYWSWDAPDRPAPLGPADDVRAAVKAIKNVVCQDRA